MRANAEKLSDEYAAVLVANPVIVAALVRSHGRRDPNWIKAVAYIRNKQLALDGDNQVRFRGDLLTLERFDAAQ